MINTQATGSLKHGSLKPLRKDMALIPFTIN
jgi:hypothetical protein